MTVSVTGPVGEQAENSVAVSRKKINRIAFHGNLQSFHRLLMTTVNDQQQTRFQGDGGRLAQQLIAETAGFGWRECLAIAVASAALRWKRR